VDILERCSTFGINPRPTLVGREGPAKREGEGRGARRTFAYGDRGYSLLNGPRMKRKWASSISVLASLWPSGSSSRSTS
jgi:hypothetical protein